MADSAHAKPSTLLLRTPFAHRLEALSSECRKLPKTLLTEALIKVSTGEFLTQLSVLLVLSKYMYFNAQIKGTFLRTYYCQGFRKEDSQYLLFASLLLTLATYFCDAAFAESEGMCYVHFGFVVALLICSVSNGSLNCNYSFLFAPNERNKLIL